MKRRNKPDLPVPLTVDYLLDMTYTVSFGTVKTRHLDKMYWYENTDTMMLETRVSFINQLMDNVREMRLPRRQPLTLISYDSAGFLTEYYLHLCLKQAGFGDVRWRLLDTGGNDKAGRQDFESFAAKTGASAALLVADRDYLYEGSGSGQIAVEDRAAGGTIILHHRVRPDFPPQPDFEKIKAEGGLVLRGGYSSTGHGANSVYVFFSDGADMHETQKHIVNRRISEYGLYLKIAVKLTFIDNKFAIDCSDNEGGRLLKRALETTLSINHMPYAKKREEPPAMAPPAAPNHKMALLPKFSDAALTEYSYFKFKDYDITLESLHRFFRDGAHGCLFAALNENGFSFQ